MREVDVTADLRSTRVSQAWDANAPWAGAALAIGVLVYALGSHGLALAHPFLISIGSAALGYGVFGLLELRSARLDAGAAVVVPAVVDRDTQLDTQPVTGE